MGDFKKRFGGSGGGFGGRNGGRGGFGGGRDRGPTVMHQAVCDQCGQPCEVPFRPSGEKPVYCNTCFGSKKEMGDNRGGDRFPQRSYDGFKPNFGGGSIGKGGNDEVKKQLEMLNGKMDRLVRAIEVMAKIKPLVETEKAKEAVKTAAVVKTKKSSKR